MSGDNWLLIDPNIYTFVNVSGYLNIKFNICLWKSKVQYISMMQA